MKTIELFDERRLDALNAEPIASPEGMQKSIIQDGRADPFSFLMDVTLAAHNNRLYAAWYNSTSAEICGSSFIRGRYSEDGGATWSPPYGIVGEAGQSEEHYVPADLFVHQDALYALITTMSGKNLTQDLRLYRQRRDPAEKWDCLGKIAPGVICNTPPQRMKNGCYIVGAWRPMKDEDPAYPMVLISDGDNLASAWRSVLLFDPLNPQSPHIRCAETTLLTNGASISLFIRNDEGPSLFFLSHDYGETWSGPMANAMPIGNSKICAGRLSDGRPYLIYNHERGYFIRTLLVLAIGNSKTGLFEKTYRIFEGDDTALGRGRIWFYPAACEQNGFLYIGAVLQEPSNIRNAVLAKIPIANF